MPTPTRIDVAVQTEYDFDDQSSLDSWYQKWCHRTVDKYVAESEKLRTRWQEHDAEHERALNVYKTRLHSTQTKLESKCRSARKDRSALEASASMLARTKEELDRHRGLTEALRKQSEKQKDHSSTVWRWNCASASSSKHF